MCLKGCEPLSVPRSCKDRKPSTAAAGSQLRPPRLGALDEKNTWLVHDPPHCKGVHFKPSQLLEALRGLGLGEVFPLTAIRSLTDTNAQASRWWITRNVVGWKNKDRKNSYVKTDRSAYRDSSGSPPAAVPNRAPDCTSLHSAKVLDGVHIRGEVNSDISIFHV